MNVEILSDKMSLGAKAASRGAAAIRGAIARQGRAAIIVATGASQFEMLGALVASPGIDWSKVTAFHLDEYVGLAVTHPASFRRYLHERFVSRLPDLGRFVPVTAMPRISPARSTAQRAARRRETSMSASQASARTAISPSTIRRPISRPTIPTSS